MSVENYHRVGSSIWREFRTDDTRIMAAYILTCQHRSTEGLFSLPFGYIVADLNWPRKRVLRSFEEVTASRLVEYSSEQEVCFIIKALKWQSPANENQRIAALKRLAAVPETWLDRRFYAAAIAHAPAFADCLYNEMPQRFGNCSSTGSPTNPPTNPPTGPPTGPPTSLGTTHAHTQDSRSYSTSGLKLVNPSAVAVVARAAAARTPA